MPTLTAALVCQNNSESLAAVEMLAASSAVTKLVLIAKDSGEPLRLSSTAQRKSRLVECDVVSGRGVNRLLECSATDHLLLVLPGQQLRLGEHAVERLLSVAEDSGAGLVYSDFQDYPDGHSTEHALIDYQLGSIRDGFDFGGWMLISKRAASEAVGHHGPIDEQLRWGGLYDLRLKLSIDSTLQRIPEQLYTRIPVESGSIGERQFDYVDPRQRDCQVEMEAIATDHLKRIGAYRSPSFSTPNRSDEQFPARASIVIPVRNRERTIKDSVLSALSQRASFEFNVIVVDNHSTDRTTQILEELASQNRWLIPLKPARTDLGIGGCWNEAIYSNHCGEYAVQLDSDDLYAHDKALATIIAKFEEKPYAMVIASYTIVNFDLQEIPPGLIDHREWTRENGRNNALRINGLGAPRAFYVPLLRQFGFPNVSYGEDYAVALRISREYEIGRIYDSLYFARRWEGNSDATLPLATANRYDAYKDHLRTVEIIARRKLNRQCTGTEE